jgi:hypothetical protein
MFAPQTDTVCPTAKYVEIQKGILLYLVDSRDVHHCPILLSWSADFSSLRDASRTPLQLQALVLGFMSPSSRRVSDLFKTSKLCVKPS